MVNSSPSFLCSSTVYFLLVFFHFIPLFSPPLCSLSVTNPACAGLDNKLSGEKRLKEVEGVGSFTVRRAKCPYRNVETIVTAPDDSHSTVTLVGTGNET